MTILQRVGRGRSAKPGSQGLNHFSIQGQQTGAHKQPQPDDILSKLRHQQPASQNIHQKKILKPDPDEPAQKDRFIPVDDVLERIRKFRKDLQITMKSATSHNQQFIRNEAPLIEHQAVLESVPALQSQLGDKTIPHTDEEVGDSRAFSMTDLYLEHEITDSADRFNRLDEGDSILYRDEGAISWNPGDDVELELSTQGQCEEDVDGHNQAEKRLGEIESCRENADPHHHLVLHEHPITNPRQVAFRLNSDMNQEGDGAGPEPVSCAAGDDTGYHGTNDACIGDSAISLTVDVTLQHNHVVPAHIASVETQVAVKLVDAAVGNTDLSKLLVDASTGDGDLSIVKTIDASVGEFDHIVETRESGIGEADLKDICVDIGIGVDFMSEWNQLSIDNEKRKRQTRSSRDMACNTNRRLHHQQLTNTKSIAKVDQNIQTVVAENQPSRHQSTETDPEQIHISPDATASFMKDDDREDRYREGSRPVRARFAFTESSNSMLEREQKRDRLCDVRVQSDEVITHSSLHDAANQIMSELDNVLYRLRHEVIIADELLEQSNESISMSMGAGIEHSNSDKRAISTPDSNHKLPCKQHLGTRPQFLDGGRIQPQSEHSARALRPSYRDFTANESQRFQSSKDWIRPAKENGIVGQCSVYKNRYSSSSRAKYAESSTPSLPSTKSSIKPRLLYRTAIDGGPSDIIQKHIYRHGLDNQHFTQS